MSELAKTHIEITDESSYGAGTSTIIPLYIFATEQDKVIDEDTGEIAPGTSKAVANELLVVTSQKDVTNTFGIPNFTVVDGTIQQGDELNEYGLYALYSGMGSASLGYALRADIDLKQLKPSKSEPVSEVENKSLWFDTADTSYGLFRSNGNIRPALAWDRIESVLLPELSDLVDGKPKSTYGNDGDLAVVNTYNENGKVLNEQKIYENIAQEWYELGSKEWKQQFASEVRNTTNNPNFEDGSKISVQGVEITLTKSNVASVAEDFVNAINKGLEVSHPEISASIESGYIVIRNDNSLLEIKELDDKKTLEMMGFEVSEKELVVHSVYVTHKTHSQVPTTTTKGSIWIKTTEPNNGAKYILKQYNSTTKSWNSRTLPMYGSFLTAEKVLGSALANDSIIVKYDDESVAETKMYKYGSQEYTVINGEKSNPSITPNDEFYLSTLVGGEIREYRVRAFSTTVKDLARAIANLKIANIIADVTDDGKLQITSTSGNTIAIKAHIGTILTDIGLYEGEYSTWTDNFAFDIKPSEPTSLAKEGTLWFSDDYKVDIMVNDGDEWKGYANYQGNKSSNVCAKIMVQSNQPEEHEDGSALVDNDLWINTAATNYPEIHRYMLGEWELVDNADQTTPLGIVFADARENAGPEYDGSKHTAFSEKLDDMVISDYVDPNCPNPQSYPEGILLFNTLYSTNNIKKMTNEYVSARKELGEKFTVGNSKEFATPGTEMNPKTTRWETASGNAEDGAGLFGRKAQRRMVVRALAEAINSNDDIRSSDYDFFFVNCAGYPELDDEIKSLNVDKKEMFYNVSDTPARLSPKANDILNWGSNKNNAVAHGEEGRIVFSAYQTRQYPSMGLASNVDGNDIAVPSSIAKMKALLTLPRGMAAAGTQYGQVKNLASVGYISEENEYVPVTVKDGLGEIIVSQKMNPIMSRRNTGLLFWGENTENSYTSSLSDEHAVLTILRLKRELDAACLPFFFQPNTEALRKDFDAVLRSILADYVSRGELYDFTLVTDRTVNTNERIERKELWAEIAVDITKFVEQVYLPIRIVRTGSLSSAA